MSDEFDPEVLADLQLRDATTRDRTRSSKPPTWSPPKILGQVPCRARCGKLCDWTEEAEQAFATWNRLLERRDEAPLDKTRIVFCEDCRTEGKKLVADAKRKHVEFVAVEIRKLKAASNPENEHEAIKRSTALGHPDLPGLLQTLRKKLDGGKARRNTEGL